MGKYGGGMEVSGDELSMGGYGSIGANIEVGDNGGNVSSGVPRPPSPSRPLPRSPSLPRPRRSTLPLPLP